MKSPEIAAIAAIGKNREIGKDNRLPWRISEDSKRFRRLTNGHALIMGRKTFDSIGRPLPNRTNIIITRSLLEPAGIVIAHSLDEAIEMAQAVETERIFIGGGAQIYEQAMSITDKLFLTVVDAEFDADTFFPDYSEFTKVVDESSSESEDYKYRFLELEREDAV